MKPIMMICGVLLFAGLATAQAPEQFYAHADIVKPSMAAAYFSFLKNAKETYQKQGVSMSYSVFLQDDNTCYFFSPMEGLNIGKIYEGFGAAESKIGKDAFGKLLAEKEKCIESHSEFITRLLPQYTYLNPGEGENFRNFMFWFPLPGKQAEVDQIAKEWIDLHRSKKATNGYQTFRTVFGGEPGYVIVNWGKDELDFVTKSKQTNELFGEEAGKLWQRTMAITHRVYFKNAWYLPDLSYYPAPVAVK
jgi:hypothetical protein